MKPYLLQVLLVIVITLGVIQFSSFILNSFNVVGYFKNMLRDRMLPLESQAFKLIGDTVHEASTSSLKVLKEKIKEGSFTQNESLSEISRVFSKSFSDIPKSIPSTQHPTCVTSERGFDIRFDTTFVLEGVSFFLTWKASFTTAKKGYVGHLKYHVFSPSQPERKLALSYMEKTQAFFQSKKDVTVFFEVPCEVAPRASKPKLSLVA